MTLTKPYEATFVLGDNETKRFSFLFDEVSENFIRVIIKRVDGSVYTPIFSVDMELKQVVFGEDEITPTDEDIICIYRDTPTIQDTQFNTLQGYNAKALENMLSKIVAMIQEMKSSGFSTQVLQGEPWSLDLLTPEDDGAIIQIDYAGKKLKKGLHFRIKDGVLEYSKDGVLWSGFIGVEDIANLQEQINNIYTKQEIDNKVIVINAGIDGNTQAIQKTRDDYIAADSEIHQILNNHASELTTLRGNQASLGDQVAGIEGKIPESASGTNPLITKQQLLDEEMDIRDDLNEMASELQTQITAQAAEIATKQDQLTAGDNIIISNNVISATGAGGGAGLSIVVVQELPATGQKGTIYLLAKDGSAPDIYDEYVWIAATQSFELIGSTQVDLTDYAKKEYVDNAIAEFESFPDQTGNAGKFLQTDGTTASWGDALVNRNSGRANSVIIKTEESTNYGSSAVAVGSSAAARDKSVHIGFSSFDMLAGGGSVGVGYNTTTYNYSVAIGFEAKTGVDYAIQIGYKGKNSDPNTFKVANQNGNFEMMSADGTIPADRMSATAGTTGQVLTKTDTGMAWQEAPAGGTKITIIRYDE